MVILEGDRVNREEEIIKEKIKVYSKKRKYLNIIKLNYEVKK